MPLNGCWLTLTMISTKASTYPSVLTTPASAGVVFSRFSYVILSMR